MKLKKDKNIEDVSEEELSEFYSDEDDSKLTDSNQLKDILSDAKAKMLTEGNMKMAYA